MLKRELQIPGWQSTLAVADSQGNGRKGTGVVPVEIQQWITITSLRTLRLAKQFLIGHPSLSLHSSVHIDCVRIDRASPLTSIGRWSMPLTQRDTHWHTLSDTNLAQDVVNIGKCCDSDALSKSKLSSVEFNYCRVWLWRKEREKLKRGPIKMSSWGMDVVCLFAVLSS